jgi:hypothetical protein
MIVHNHTECWCRKDLIQPTVTLFTSTIHEYNGTLQVDNNGATHITYNINFITDVPPCVISLLPRCMVDIIKKPYQSMTWKWYKSINKFLHIYLIYKFI